MSSSVHLRPFVNPKLYPRIPIFNSLNLNLPLSELGSSDFVSLSLARSQSSRSLFLLTTKLLNSSIPRLHVSSSELLVPRSKLRNQVVTRHSSCRVYPPQLSTTTVVWIGASYHSRTNSLQYTRWQSGDCPTDHTRCQTRDENAHRVTARRL